MARPYLPRQSARKASASSREHARLLRLGAGVDLDEQARGFAELLDFVGERGGDLLAVDRLDDVESLDRLARLVALQGPDQMKLDRLVERGREGPELAPFRHRLLHPVLAEPRLAAERDGRPDVVGGKGLGHGDELDLLGRPAAVARPARDRLAQPARRATAPKGSSGWARSVKIRLRFGVRRLPEVRLLHNLTRKSPSPIDPRPMKPGPDRPAGRLSTEAASVVVCPPLK